MARLEFKLPDIGEGIAEAEIVEWHAQVGDAVAEGQVIVAVMTDKATVEMEAPTAGTILERGAEAGAILPIGTMLFAMDTEEETPAGDDEATPAKPVDPIASPPAEPAVATARAKPGEAGPPAASHGRILASPAVRRRARELGVDLASVRTSGGRVRHEDLDRYLVGQHPAIHGGGQEMQGEEIPLTGLRRRIARHMEEAKQHIPHFTYVEELDVTELELLRETLNRQEERQPPLHLLPFLILAICRALRDFPMLNAHYDDERDVITQFDPVHVGIATQTDKGLMVPVLRDAHLLDIRQIAGNISELAARARSGEITRDELRGSTITVSSLGKLGGIAATPIINRPEVAILAPNRIVERSIWFGNIVEPRKIMNVSMSCDHRVIDGHVAASFIQALKQLLETPASLAIV